MDACMFVYKKNNKIAISTFVFISAVLFSLLTVYVHVQYLGIHYLEEGNQIKRHLSVLQGTAPDPWQYRILSDYLVEAIIQLFTKLDVPHSIAAAFISLRCVLGVMIFLISYFYFRKLGFTTAHSLIGMSVLAWV